MLKAIAAALLFGNFTTPSVPKAPPGVIESHRDRGPVYELVVRCTRGTTIVLYAKDYALYCAPDGMCHGSLTRAISHACRPRAG